MSMEFPDEPRRAGDQPHVVIPFSFANREFAGKLAGALRQDGISPWIDEVDMSAGVFLTKRIFKAGNQGQSPISRPNHVKAVAP